MATDSFPLPLTDFLPQPLNASLRDSSVLFLYRPLLSPFPTPAATAVTSGVIALTLEEGGGQPGAARLGSPVTHQSRCG